MRDVREGEPETWFPEYGARARRWSRFERDLREWLETPGGPLRRVAGPRGDHRRGAGGRPALGRLLRARAAVGADAPHHQLRVVGR